MDRPVYEWLRPGGLLNLIHWTSSASRQLRRRLADVAAATGLSDTELLVVWLCSADGHVQVEIAAAIGVSPAQMSGLVERLRSRGLVAMHRLAHDRRRQIWKATDAGPELLESIAERLQELERTIAGRFHGDELHAATGLCKRMADALSADSGSDLRATEHRASKEAA
jgi:DNA-binding MarR family transcriptional regulator